MLARASVSLLVVAALVLGLPSPALAQGAAPDAGEPDRIRAAFVARRDPAILLDLSASLRKLGRHADAAAVYDEWRRTPGADPARVPDVTKALAEIDAGFVGTLSITFDDPLARVWLDGRPLPGLQSGAVMRVDPGDHQVSAARGDARPTTAAVKVGVREARSVDLKMGTYVPPTAMLPPAPPPPLPPLAPAPLSYERPAASPSSADGVRVAGTVLVVTGAVGLGAGVAAGVAAIVLQTNSTAHCLGGGLACDQSGVDFQHQARTSGTVCTAALTSGGAMLLTGIILRAVGGRSSSGALPRAVAARPDGIGVTW
jgi:hypothetical protein